LHFIVISEYTVAF